MKAILRTLRQATLLLVVLSFCCETAVAQQYTGEFIKGRPILMATWRGHSTEIIDRLVKVKLVDMACENEITSLIQQYQGAVVRPFNRIRWGTIEIGPGFNLFGAFAAFEASPCIEHATPETVQRGFQTRHEPDDPYYRGTSPATYQHLWGQHNIGQFPPGGGFDDDIDAPEAWALTEGSKNVVVAILDSGLSLDCFGPPVQTACFSTRLSARSLDWGDEASPWQS